MITIDQVHMNEVDYAIRGNAILGIKDSGKTYTATYFAERLMLAGIPIIAFDPIGVWRWLQVGQAGNSGFPVVVAGDNGDLPLTPDNAVNIVRAAMQENVSLVLDLYSMQLSKAAWRRIVEDSIALLLNDNKAYGLRHVFLEEASEFVPQRVRPEYGKVYAEIEKLVRMGGNASLGITLINQRSEEVNKAVLELCDCLILHRQKGRHSITNLGKWLDAASIENPKEIIKSLPLLGKGECWIWDEGSTLPVQVQIPEKMTVHPDRRKPSETVGGLVATDVSGFVERMKKSLSKMTPVVRSKRKHDELEVEIKLPSAYERGLLEKIEEQTARLTVLQQERDEAVRGLTLAMEALRPQYEAMLQQFQSLSVLFKDIPIPPDLSPVPESDHWKLWLEQFNGKQKRMLEILIERKRLTRHQLRLLVGMSNVKSFNTYVSGLKRVDLIYEEGQDIVLKGWT